jgi:hypothetical protein
MTQPQADYVTDALEMMGIVEPKQIVTEVSGFIPVFEVVLHHYKDYMTALVFGRMWQYCGMSDGVCKATIDRLATDLEMSVATVIRHIELLEEGGYIYDQTPERRNRPHEYVDCGKVIMKGSLSAISQKNVRLSQKNVAISERQLIKQDNTNINNKPDLLDMLLENEAIAQPIRNACLEFETALLGSTVSAWPWDSNSKWQKFAKWVAAQEPSQFFKYAEWRKKDGKYQAMSNNKIRQDPQMFMDTGWPTFLAHVSMYDNSNEEHRL